MTDTESINFTIDAEEKKKFHSLCVQHNDTMANVLRQCIKHHIEIYKPRFVQVG